MVKKVKKGMRLFHAVPNYTSLPRHARQGRYDYMKRTLLDLMQI